MGEEATRYFTPDQVESLIPDLTRIMRQLMDAHAETGRVQLALRDEQRRIMMAGGGILDAEAWRERRRRLDRLTHEAQKGIAAIVSLGGVPKDLGMGLVDFPCLMDDTEVNLCWRFGETAIGFWHGLDEGFTGRKPL